MKTLYTHQREAIDALKQSDSYFYINGDPGVGKSAIAVVYAHEMCYTRVIIICPASVISTWCSELKHWSNSRASKVTSLEQAFNHLQFSVMSYTRLSQLLTGKLKKDSRGNVVRGERQRVARREVDALLQQIPALSDTLIIFDESHKLKNPAANCTAVAQQLVKKVRKCVCLSGTPASDKLIDLHAQLRLGADLGPFNSRHLFGVSLCGLVPGHFGGYECKREPDLDKLQQLTQPYMLRIDKDIVLDIPPKTYITLDVPISTADFKQLNLLEDDLKAGGLLTKTGALDFSALKLLAGHVATYRQMVGKLKVNYAIDWCVNFTETCDKALVVFAYHTDVINALADALKKKKIAVSVLQGSTTAVGRERAVTAFQNGTTRVFLTQIKAGGEGVNLQRAHHVLFVEQDWSPGTMQQAEDRVHRIGQKESTMFYSAIVKNTIDARLRELLDVKLKAVQAYQKAMNNKARPKFILRPSASERFINCPGSVHQTKAIPEISNLAAEVGTAVHGYCERILATRHAATIKKEWQALVRRYPEFAHTAKTYIQYIRGYQNQPHYRVKLEQEVTIALDEAEVIKGTADALIVDMRSRAVTIVDLKTGNYVACSPASSQLGLYALGAMQRYDVTQAITTVIVQPRMAATPHVHTWTLDALETLKQQTAHAVNEIRAGTGALKAGKWCTFCPAKIFCTEYKQHGGE